MFDLDHWHEIYVALSKNRFRTLLTAFGVFWGIFMLLIMLGSGNGLQNGVMHDFNTGATNSFYVWTRTASRAYRGLPAGRRLQLTDADTAAIRAKVAGAGHVVPISQLGGHGNGNNVTRGTEAGSFSVRGIEPDLRYIEPVRVTAGRFLDRLDLVRQRKVAVIGDRVRSVLFREDEDPIGGFIRIHGIHFRVVGVFGSYKSGEDAADDAERVYVPHTTFQRTFNAAGKVGWYAIAARPGIPAAAVETQVVRLLRGRLRVHPDDDRSIGHWNTEEDFRQLSGLFLGIHTLVWIVGIGTLTAGVIGVSNIMLVIVRERTREIGVRRALGATPASVMLQIVLEALLLTAVAGSLGLVVGVAAIEAIGLAVGDGSGMFRAPAVSLGSAVQAFLILILSGVFAGLLPAQRAVAVAPVDALRAE